MNLCSNAQRYRAYKLCGIKNRDSSFLRLALSNKTPNPAATPARAGIYPANGGGLPWRFLRRQITYFANITMDAKKAVENKTFLAKDHSTLFGLKLKTKKQYVISYTRV